MSETISGKELMRRWAVGVPKLRSLLSDEGVEPTSAISWDAPKEITVAHFLRSDVRELELRYPELKSKAEEYTQKDYPNWWQPDDGVVGRQGATGGGEAMQPSFNGFAEEEAKRLRQENMKLKEELKALKKQKNNLPARERWKRSVAAAVGATIEIITSGSSELTRDDALIILDKYYEGEDIQRAPSEAESTFWKSLPQEMRKQKGRPKKVK